MRLDMKQCTPADAIQMAEIDRAADWDTDQYLCPGPFPPDDAELLARNMLDVWDKNIWYKVVDTDNPDPNGSGDGVLVSFARIRVFNESPRPRLLRDEATGETIPWNKPSVPGENVAAANTWFSAISRNLDDLYGGTKHFRMDAFCSLLGHAPAPLPLPPFSPHGLRNGALTPLLPDRVRSLHHIQTS